MRRSRSRALGREPQPDLGGLAGADVEVVVQRRLGAGPRRVDGRRAADDVVVDPVLRDTRGQAARHSRRVLVSLSQNSGSGVPSPASTIASRAAASSAASAPPSIADRRLARRRGPTTRCCGTTASGAGRCSRRSRPGVADADAHADVVGRGLGVVDRDVPVAVVEHAGVEQLVLGRGRDRAARSRRSGPRTGTPPGGRRSASASTSASASSRGTTSTPWRPRRGCPRARSARRSAP